LTTTLAREGGLPGISTSLNSQHSCNHIKLSRNSSLFWL